MTRRFNLKAISDWQRSFIKNRIFHDSRAMLILGLSVVLNAIAWYLWYSKIVIVGPIYNPFANEFLGTFNLNLPILALVLIIINLVIAIYSWNKEKLASYILLSIGFFIQILILILFYFYLKV